jgi:CBS domain-containing protein
MSEPQPSKESTQKTGQKLINSNVVFVNQDALIQDVVLEMIKNNISSVLVEEPNGQIVGIITERDIVRKFTLLDMGDKLTRTVSTIMTRPVAFVQLEDFREQIVKLHLEQRIRHFPVLSAKEAKRDNLVGIISITDVARFYMLEDKDRKQAQAPAKTTSKPTVGVLTSTRSFTNSYVALFNKLGFDTKEVTDLHQFASDHNAEKFTLILDMDGYADKDIHNLIPVAVKAKFHLILTTSKPSLIPVFKKYMNQERQEIAMKPIDISYLSWLILNKWHMPSLSKK